MAFLEVKNLRKRFGDTEVLKGIGFTLEKGEVISVIGSSGNGKTTLLRCLNFLEMPESGSISVGGEEIFDAAKKIYRRRASAKPPAFRAGVSKLQSFPAIFGVEKRAAGA